MIWRVAIEGITFPFSSREKKAGDKSVSSANLFGEKADDVGRQRAGPDQGVREQRCHPPRVKQDCTQVPEQQGRHQAEAEGQGQHDRSARPKCGPCFAHLISSTARVAAARGNVPMGRDAS